MLFKKIFILFFLVTIIICEAVLKSGSVSPFIFQILFNKNIELKNTDPKNVNLLLLGIGGGNHDGPLLSDTIIYANIDIKNSKISLISLPRDLWSNDLKGRINSAYAKGEAKKKGGGLILAKTVIGKITGQPIDYVLVIDFSGFIKAVDLMGGLNVQVDRTFDDYQYPIEGKENELCGHSELEIESYIASNSAESDLPNFFPCRYEHLFFEKGEQYMDGETALKFVRSRHAKGEEGTDFARSQRQEKVIRAFMDKAFSLKIIGNPTKVLDLYNTLKESIDTDIEQNNFDDFIKLAQKMQNAKLQSVVVDYGDQRDERGGLLTHPPISEKYNYEWTLVPRIGDNNYEEIHEFIRCRLERDECIVSQIP